MTPGELESGSLADFDAQAIVRRAAELQAAAADRTSVQDLRRLAEEIGIDNIYLDEALEEFRARNPRRLTTTITPAPFLHAYQNGLDPADRRGALSLIATANSDHSHIPCWATQYSSESASYIERAIPFAIDPHEFDLVAGIVAQMTRLQTPLTQTGSSLHGVVNLGWVYAKLSLTSRGNATKISLKFLGHASREFAIALSLVCAFLGVAVFVTALPLVGAGFALAVVLSIGAYSGLGNRARESGRKLLGEIDYTLRSRATRLPANAPYIEV